MKKRGYLHGYLHNHSIEQKVQPQGSFDVRSLLEMSWAIVLHSIRHIPAIVTQNEVCLRISPELSYEAAHAPLHPQSEFMRKPRRALLAAALVSIIPAFVFLVPSDTIPQAIRPRSSSADALPTQTIFLPWTKPFSRASGYTPSVLGVIAGSRQIFPIDTTSTGVVIGANRLPKLQLGKGNPVGWRFISDNSILLTGQIANLPITFYGSKRSQQAISQVPVLVITKIVRCPGFNKDRDKGVCPLEKLDKKYKQHLNSVLFMGVGFGVTAPGNGSFPSIPSHDPFLNVMRLTDYNTLSMRKGYVITARGVYLGLTDDNTSGAVWTRLGKLAGTTDPQAWAGPLVSFTSGTSNESTQARALIDISTTQMKIQSSLQSTLPNRTVSDGKTPPEISKRVITGTKLNFAFLDMGKGVAGYDFVVGDSKFPGSPSHVEVVTKGAVPYVSPGRNILYGFSIVFDAVAGRFGLICTKCK
ncbi:hypothetical protein HBH95_161290 [Parastagonospora nodorum]|nr:hypothetical protein HBH95_161290 [Parastagonospora nodorum]KAH5761828.1 hypothetical protein HBI16_176070 [Parastagonospora nodorum]KAH6406418.1 hypothetical protein HBI14_164560 [Parastagonospora nodorum]KAH6439097.1 hypothetical protein HBI59_152330 [Parastagonospora nodorum]